MILFVIDCCELLDQPAGKTAAIMHLVSCLFNGEACCEEIIRIKEAREKCEGNRRARIQPAVATNSDIGSNVKRCGYSRSHNNIKKSSSHSREIVAGNCCFVRG